MYVHIEWIRHGMSCANIIKVLNPYSLTKRSELAPDSQLSNIGIEQCNIFNTKYYKRYKKFDLLCCSQLRRAIETAKICFKGTSKKIFVLPYVSEYYPLKILSKNNIPISYEHNLDNSFLKILGIKFENPSVKKFNNIILPMLIYLAKKRNKYIGTKKRPVKIAIVSHQIFINRKTNNKLNNNGIQIEQLEYKNKNIRIINTKTFYNPKSLYFNGKKYIINKKGYINKKDITENMYNNCDNYNKF